MKKMNPKWLLTRASYLRSWSETIVNFSLRLFLTVAVFLLMLAAAFSQKYDGKYFNNLDANGVIIDGYDPVAFFTDHKPVKGNSQFQYKYQDAIYYFTSQQHLELFKANPEKYKPQFGGWCAYAVSLGRVAPIDVNTFSIVNERLVIQHNQRAVNGWSKDVQGNLALADKYWPKVTEHGGKQIQTDAEKEFLNNTDKGGIILQGYDAVSYFTSNKAELGDPKYSARYNGATYWFVSDAHASMFKDHPEMFAPQYGAFCGYAMSLGKLRPIDPSIFQIVDGRLILQHSQDAFQQFNKDVPGNIQRADAHWPGQVKKHAGKKVKFDKPAKPASGDKNSTSLIIPTQLGGNNTETQPASAVAFSFAKEFSGAKDISWTKINEAYVAEFHQDENKSIAFYSEDAKLIGVGKFITADHLPFVVFDRIIDRFSPIAFKSVLEFYDGSSTEYYVMIEDELSGKILKVSSSGEISVEKSKKIKRINLS